MLSTARLWWSSCRHSGSPLLFRSQRFNGLSSGAANAFNSFHVSGHTKWVSKTGLSSLFCRFIRR